MTDGDMRALALNLAHSEPFTGKGTAGVIEKAEAYLAFLMARSAVTMAARPAVASASASALNPYAASYNPQG